MGYIVTRSELRSQLRDEIRYVASSGAGSDAELNRRLQREVRRVWEKLTRTADGVGMGTLTKTIATGDPDGYVPGERVPLPDDFRRVSDIWVDKGAPELGTPAEVEGLAVQGTAVPYRWPLLYYVDGPGQQSGGTAVVAQQIRLFPDWREGQVLTLLYVRQPPSLGDPEQPADDTIDVDLLAEPVVRYVVARAAVRSVSRDDAQGYQRALDEMAQAEDDFERTRALRVGSPLRLSSFQRRPGRTAPWP